MRVPEKQRQAAYRIARPTPAYADDVSEEFLRKQQAHVESTQPEGFELTPISGDAW